MAQPWQPLESGVVQLVNLLTEYQKLGTNQAEIFKQLEQCQQFPDFNNYLSFLFSQAETLPIEVRQSAGLLLKNNLPKQLGSTSEELKAYIKAALLPVLRHPQRDLRRTAGTIASVIVGSGGGFRGWPELVDQLISSLQSEDPNALDGGLDTLYKVIEDYAFELEATLPHKNNSPASPFLVPPLLRLLQSPHGAVRRMALACLNLLARDLPSGISSNLDTYLQGLFALATDIDNSVRKEVCCGLVSLTGMVPDKLAPFLPQLVEYMLASNEHNDEGVALASAEFWTTYQEAQLELGLLKPYLPRLIPVLMKNMVFDEYDDEVADAEAAESSGPHQREDRDQDLRPFHHKQSEHGASGMGDGTDANGDGGGDDDDDPMSRWNLRKCSAEALDVLSNNFRDELLPVLLPIVEQRLQDPDWRARESAILALGAVAQGCHQGLQPFLAGMVQMLLPKLADPRPMVRIISCWTLARYSHWLLSGVVERGPEGKALLDPVVAGILGRLCDHNKFVQAAAVSALAELVETASEGFDQPVALLGPYLQAIMETIAGALATYTRRNLAVTYEALSLLARGVGHAMADPALVAIYMPPLFAKYNSLQASDRDLLPLMECLATVTVYMGRTLETYAKPIFDKALQVVMLHLEAQRAGGQAGAAAGAAGGPGPAAGQVQGVLEYDPDFVVLGLDLVSGLAQGLKVSVEALVGPSHLLQVLVHCCRDPLPEVRQSAFALVGDLCVSCIAHVLPAAAELVPAALAGFDVSTLRSETMSAANNACWSLGELAVRMDPTLLAPNAERIAQYTAAILCYQGQRMPSGILENCAILLGRTAWRCPEHIAPHLAHFCGQWCRELRNIRDGEEKEHAFLGLCRVLKANPQAALPAFPLICAAFASWRHLALEALRADMAEVVQAYKGHLASTGQLEQVVSTMQESTRKKLAQMGMAL